MGRATDIAIDLDGLTDRDWADARAIMAAGGVDPDALSLAAIQADPAAAPVPTLAALIYVQLRKDAPRITAGRCVRLAQAVTGG